MELGEELHKSVSSLARRGLTGGLPEPGISCRQLGEDLLQLGPILWEALGEGSDEASSRGLILKKLHFRAWGEGEKAAGKGLNRKQITTIIIIGAGSSS